MAKKLRSTTHYSDRQEDTKELASTPSGTSNSLDRWKDDLVEAQKKRAELQADLKRVNNEAQKLQNQGRVDTKRIGDLTLENSTLGTKMRDRAEELKGKAKLLEVKATLNGREILMTVQFVGSSTRDRSSDSST